MSDKGPGAVELRGVGLRKSFGSHAVLGGVDLTIERGQIVAIVGGSGSGKTVLLDVMTRLIPADDGRMEVAHHGLPGAPLVELYALEDEQLDEVRLHWAIVFQRNALFSGSVHDNIALWLREHTDLGGAAIRRRVRESLEASALDVDDVINKSREELSGGMAKRVAIARAIAMDPAVVFYDEPTTGLDPVMAARIHELIFGTHHSPRDDGTVRTTVIVTHDKELLRRVRPRVVMLDKARVCFDGAYEQFGKSRNAMAREYLRAMPVLHARPIDEVGVGRV